MISTLPERYISERKARREGGKAARGAGVSAPRHRRIPGVPAPGRGGLRGVGAREEDVEGGSPAGSAVDFDRTLVGAHHGLHDAQPQPEPAVGTALLPAEKPLEDPGELLFRGADPAVRDCYLYVSAARESMRHIAAGNGRAAGMIAERNPKYDTTWP